MINDVVKGIKAAVHKLRHEGTRAGALGLQRRHCQLHRVQHDVAGRAVCGS